jgi:hypothetical protein
VSATATVATALASVATTTAPATAHASPRTSAVKLCNEKFGGPPFAPASSEPRRNYRIVTPRGRILGWVVSAGQNHPRLGRRICAVTIRKYRKHRQFTSVKEKNFYYGRKWRKDASHVYRKYAGPIVLRINQGDCVKVVGQIGRYKRDGGCWI